MRHLFLFLLTQPPWGGRPGRVPGHKSVLSLHDPLVCLGAVGGKGGAGRDALEMGEGGGGPADDTFSCEESATQVDRLVGGFSLVEFPTHTFSLDEPWEFLPAGKVLSVRSMVLPSLRLRAWLGMAKSEGLGGFSGLGCKERGGVVLSQSLGVTLGGALVEVEVWKERSVFEWE